MITTPVDETLLDVIPEITGAVVSAAADVVKVKFPDVAILPAVSVLFTR